MGKKLTASSTKPKSGAVVVPAATNPKANDAPPKLSRHDSGVDVTKAGQTKPLPVTLLSGFLVRGPVAAKYKPLEMVH